MADGKSVLYRITLRPQPGDVPAILRIRQLLKYAQRAQLLDCVEMAELPDSQPAKRRKAKRRERQPGAAPPRPTDFPF